MTKNCSRCGKEVPITIELIYAKPAISSPVLNGMFTQTVNLCTDCVREYCDLVDTETKKKLEALNV